MAEDVKINIQVDGNAEKALKVITKSLKDLGNESQTTASKTSSAFDVFKGTLGALGVAGLFNSAFQAGKQFFNSLVTDGIAAAQVQEDAIKKLNTALAQSGDFSVAASQDLQAFASQLQQTSTIGDEAAISQLALAKSFGASNEQAKLLVQAAADLSAQTGITLESAVKNLGKTMGGLTGELGEVVPELKNLTKEQLKAGAAIDFVAAKFAGSALAQTTTFSGATKQLSNTFGDFTETIGGFVTKNPAVISAIAILSEKIFGLNQTLAGEQGGITKFINELVPNVIRGIGYMVQGFGYLVEITETALLPFTTGIQLGTTAIVALSAAMSGDFETAKVLMMEGMEEVKQSIGEAFSFEDSETLKAAEAIKELAVEVEEATARTNAAINTLPVNADQANKKIKKSTADNSLAIKSFEESNNKERLSNFQSTLGTISTLTKSTNSELFAIGKASAIANATIDGLLAVQKALASAPAPFNFVLAALVGAATASNIAQISAQQPPALATGSTFVNGPATGDVVPAFLQRGERVFTSAQNQDFSAFLETNGNNNVILAAIFDRLENLQNGVMVNVGGKTLVNTLQEELDAGLVLSV